MIKHIKNEVKKAIKIAIQNAKFVTLTCDEVISMDNASWASVCMLILFKIGVTYPCCGM
jgi:hypothetical protein